VFRTFYERAKHTDLTSADLLKKDKDPALLPASIPTVTEERRRAEERRRRPTTTKGRLARKQQEEEEWRQVDASHAHTAASDAQWARLALPPVHRDRRCKRSRLDENEAAGYQSFIDHATVCRGSQKVHQPGANLAESFRGLYVSVRAGFVVGGLVASGGQHERQLITYIHSWRQHWVTEAGKNACHAANCPNPIWAGGCRGGTEVIGGLRNILYAAVALLHSQGEGFWPGPDGVFGTAGPKEDSRACIRI
jgi:hypothetical protein